MSAQDRELGPSADLRARVLAEVSRTPAPTRTEHGRRRLVVAAAGVLATTALFVATGGVVVGARPASLVAFTAGLGLLLAVVVSRVIAPSGSMLGRPRKVLVSAAAALAPALALVALAAASIWPEHASEEVPPSIDLGCAVLTVLQGALPLAIFLAPRRGTDPVHPAITGAAIGAAAGAWTAMMAYLRCPHAAPLHCVVAHVVPTLVLVTLGALLGRSLLAVRARP